MWDFTSAQDVSNVVPVGVYNVIVSQAEQKTSSSGNEMLKISFKITDGEHKGRMIFENFMLSGNEKSVQINMSRLKALLTCAGHKLNIEGPHEFVGLEVAASVKIKTDEQYGDKNTISMFKPKAAVKDTTASKASPF